MRRPTAFFAAIAVQAVLAASTPAAAQTAGDALVVQINHTTRLTVRGSAAQVFVGNANIADVAIVSHNTLMLTGKAFGQTNIQVIDAVGRTILNREVQVAGSTAGAVTLYRGANPTSYTCGASCQATPAAAPSASTPPAP